MPFLLWQSITVVWQLWQEFHSFSLGAYDSIVVYTEVSGGEIMSSTFDPEMQEAAFPLPGSSSAIQLPENSQFHPSVSSAAIPPDQLYMIGNINALILEVA